LNDIKARDIARQALQAVNVVYSVRVAQVVVARSDEGDACFSWLPRPAFLSICCR